MAAKCVKRQKVTNVIKHSKLTVNPCFSRQVHQIIIIIIIMSKYIFQATFGVAYGSISFPHGLPEGTEVSQPIQ